MVPVTSLKKIGSVGRDFFFLTLLSFKLNAADRGTAAMLLIVVRYGFGNGYEKNSGNTGNFKVGLVFFLLIGKKSARVGTKN